MKKFIVLLFLLPIVALAQPKKVDLVGTFMIATLDSTRDTATITSKTIYTDAFGIESSDSVSFVVEYEINDSLNHGKFIASPYLANLKDTLSYSLASFSGKLKSSNYITLNVATSWLVAAYPDEVGIHFGKGIIFANSVYKIQLQLKVGYGNSSGAAVKFPTFWHKRTLRAKIYKITN